MEIAIDWLIDITYESELIPSHYRILISDEGSLAAKVK